MSPLHPALELPSSPLDPCARPCRADVDCMGCCATTARPCPDIARSIDARTRGSERRVAVWPGGGLTGIESAYSPKSSSCGRAAGSCEGNCNPKHLAGREKGTGEAAGPSGGAGECVCCVCCVCVCVLGGHLRQVEQQDGKLEALCKPAVCDRRDRKPEAGGSARCYCKRLLHRSENGEHRAPAIGATTSVPNLCGLAKLSGAECKRRAVSCRTVPFISCY